MSPGVPEADVLAALNFSVGYFHARDELVAYLRHARASVRGGGVVVLNTFGGENLYQPSVALHRVTPPDEAEHAGAAFVYDWRLWTPVELVETLREAGFARAEVWRHTAGDAQDPATASLGRSDASNRGLAGRRT